MKAAATHIVIPRLKRNNAGVKLALVVDDHLLPRLSEHDTRLTPREVVHLPERVEREVEREDGDGKDVEEHPADHVPLAPQNEYKHLDGVDGDDHDEGDGLDLLVLGGDQVDEVDDLRVC